MSDDQGPEDDGLDPAHTEVQISIEGMRITGPELTLEADEIVISATGPDADKAAESVRGLLVSLFDRFAERAGQ
jgi:purine nucleoside permease